MKKFFISAVFIFILANLSFADVNRTISSEFAVAIMNTPRSWSYLKNMAHNPIVNSMLGGVAPCEGTLSVVLSERSDETLLLFTFTSQKTRRDVTYVVSDVDTFLSKLAERNKSRSPKGIVCHEGVDMADSSRSNYVLQFNGKSFAMDFDRSDIGITIVLHDELVKSLLALR